MIPTGNSDFGRAFVVDRRYVRPTLSLVAQLVFFVQAHQCTGVMTWGRRVGINARNLVVTHLKLFFYLPDAWPHFLSASAPTHDLAICRAGASEKLMGWRADAHRRTSRVGCVSTSEYRHLVFDNR